MPSVDKHLPALAIAAAMALTAAARPAAAQTSTPSAPGTPQPAEQVIVPQVERRDVRLPRYASRDFSAGVFAGTYATQNFGTSAVSGLRLAYHITEDVFVEATLGRTKASDEDFRKIFPNGGIFPTPQQKVSYYSVVAGYNLLPGEVFFGRGNARLFQGYIVGGVGSTDFAGVKRQTISAGFGLRVHALDRLTVQADVRDHVYSLDLLGRRRSTQNLEVTAGLSFLF
ncbi:MAG: outer membrane beta-barrel domain-containing protein [Leptothrix sp. (in: Bacteria)]|nr:outer membrane beta-barrel domain-containing protein [Leptothrix sp. (in: b-proteobacteria)]